MEGTLDIFRCPAYKLMISDIRCAVQRMTPDHQNVNMTKEGEYVAEEQECDWLLVINNLGAGCGQPEPPLELHLQFIWIQGTVTRIMEETKTGNHSLVISDEDAGKEEAIIYEYNTVPGSDHAEIKIGSYVGVLGQICCNDPVIVKATKIMHLSDTSLCKAMWKDEVTLAKAFLAGLIVPVILS